MKKRNIKKSKKFLMRRMIAVILLFFILLSIRNAIYIWQEKAKTKQTRLLLDNESIATQNKIYIEGDTIYLSEEDVKHIFDKTIYYNVGDEELITTYHKHVAVMHLNQNEMLVNDASVPLQGQLKEIEGNIYLPISDLEIVYDLEAEYVKEVNRVILNSTTKKKSQALVLKNTKIRRSKLPFSVPIEKVKRGEDIFVLEEAGNYKKVRTKLGNIGYIKLKKISNEEIIREDLQAENTNLNLLGEYNDMTQQYGKVERKENEDNFVLLQAFESQADSTVKNKIDTQSQNYKQYFDWTTQNEIGILGTLKNGATVSASLTTYTQRNKMINSLYEQVIQNQYKGVCINFDSIDDTNSFYRFIIELTPKFKESGLKVILKNNKQIEPKKVVDIVDKII